jgi:uncharacterized RDD family membrane protein YckC
MADMNPYAAPKAVVDDVSTEIELATRRQRLNAAVLDGLVIGVCVAGGILLFGRGGGPAGIIAGTTLGMAIPAAINLWMLHRFRATIGKRSTGIRMIRSDGSEAELWRLIFLRGLPQWLLSGVGRLLPILNLLVLADVLFIFGKPRRCLHDYIADTIVVTVPKPDK